MQNPKISVIVSTYNWPEALSLVLRALNEQSYTDFEVVVADDGSTDSTQQIIQEQQPVYKQSLSHIWHEDNGFRLSAIRNKAIRHAKGEYLIFLDGDCIPRTNFIEAHAALSEPNKFVTGNRVLLSKIFTKRTLTAQNPIYHNNFLQWTARRIKGEINRLLPLFSIKTNWWRNHNRTQWKRAIGCNIAVWKSDLIKINGFDEGFVGWGYEDSDLVLRLIHSNIYRKEGRYATGVLHLWHPETQKDIENSNLTRLHQTKNSNKTTAKNGIEKEL